MPNDAFFGAGCFSEGANGGVKRRNLRSLASSLIMFLSDCFIFAFSAEIFPFETIFTHFPADEHFEHGGRLSDEEKRIKEIVSSSDGGSFVFLNELFSGTDMSKGLSLSLDYMKQLKEAGAFCLFVTHFHDAADSGFPVLYAAIDKEDENKRTYRIERGVHKRKSYASDILRKYGMDAESLSGKGGAQ